MGAGSSRRSVDCGTCSMLGATRKRHNGAISEGVTVEAPKSFQFIVHLDRCRIMYSIHNMDGHAARDSRHHTRTGAHT